MIYEAQIISLVGRRSKNMVIFIIIDCSLKAKMKIEELEDYFKGKPIPEDFIIKSNDEHNQNQSKVYKLSLEVMNADPD